MLNWEREGGREEDCSAAAQRAPSHACGKRETSAEDDNVDTYSS